jgi:trk system potassium uptake protein TrkH
VAYRLPKLTATARADRSRRLRRESRSPLRWRLVRGLVASLGLVVIVLKIGFHDPLIDTMLARVLQGGLLLVYALLLYLDARRVRELAPGQLEEYRQITRPERYAAWAGLLFCWYWPIAAAIAGLLAAIYLTRSYLRLVQTGVPSGLVFVGSFVVLIAVGTAALKLPAATHPDNPINVTDAAFTITSAISQTGLVVRPTGAELDEFGSRVIDAQGNVVPGFTRFGQIIILVWIQVGALGVIVFGALFAQLAGASFSMRATQTIGESTEQGWAGQLSTQRLVTFIIIATHFIELVGAAILYVGLPDTFEGAPYDWDGPVDKAFHSVFLSVSAFCNAGFSTTDGSLAGLRAHWTVHTVMVPLIILGSIGFPVLDNMLRVAWAKIRGKHTHEGRLIRLTLNTKLIVATSLIIYMFGYLVIFIGELLQTSNPLGLELLDAHFMNINRTAGFNTIEPSNMGLLAELGLIFLMFVGGAPGSVAGGIKVVVFAVLCLSVWATLRGKGEPTVFGRTIAPEIVRKSIAVTVLLLMGVLGTTGLLVVTEAPPPGPDGSPGEPALMPILFETVSAYGTCGLSLGITDELSTVGRWAIIVAMFIGRVGVLAILASIVAVALQRQRRVEYPHEPVTVY